MDTNLLKVTAVSKRFGGVVALRKMSLEVLFGECHALIGENGAGKTTLINILNGEVQPDEGFVELAGERIEHFTPFTSMQRGISVVHQDLALVGPLSVMENIFLAQLEGSYRGIRKSRQEMRRDTRRLIEMMGCEINPDALAEDLSTSKKQVVEIARALSSNPKLLIMDEPTASLTKAETEKLFEIIRTLTARGISIIFVSHRLNEVMSICDRITVMRDGAHIGTRDKAATTINELIRMMVGREIQLYGKLSSQRREKEVALEVIGLTKRPHFECVDFRAYRGEILGIAGLVGVGRTELAQTVFGLIQADAGVVKVNGRTCRIRSPREAMRNGIGMLPEDRKISASIDTMNIRENMSIAVLSGLSRFGLVNRREERMLAERFAHLLRIRMGDLEQSLTTLSGGNQQKVILARWLAAQVGVLMMDEPTQGVDVGAKAEIHKLLREQAESGHAVIIISSDFPEVLSISDRILVMRTGGIAGELASSDATEERIMLLATVGAY